MVSRKLPFIVRPSPGYVAPPKEVLFCTASGTLIGALFLLAVGAALCSHFRKERHMPALLGEPDVEAGGREAVEMVDIDPPTSATLQGTASTNKFDRDKPEYVAPVVQSSPITAPYSPTAVDHGHDYILPVQKSPITAAYSSTALENRPHIQEDIPPSEMSPSTLRYAPTNTDFRLTSPESSAEPAQTPRPGNLIRRGDGRRVPTSAVNTTAAHATGSSSSLAVPPSTSTGLVLPPQSEATRNLGYGEMPLQGESRLDFVEESGISGQGTIDWDW
jgi:hypothetical protein